MCRVRNRETQETGRTEVRLHTAAITHLQAADKLTAIMLIRVLHG